MDGDLELKRCGTCKMWKHVSMFHKNKSMADGLDSKCKHCKKDYQDRNKEKFAEASRRYRERHPERILEYVRTHKQSYVDYRNSHKKQISKTKSTYQSKKRKLNVEYKILCNLRTRLQNSLRRNSNGKFNTTKNLLGCSVEEFKVYLEKLFDDKMSWENYGSYWEIDHKVPCRAFNLSKPTEQAKCFHYSNMQPLEKLENRHKNDKLPNGVSARYA